MNPEVDLYLHNINWGKSGWIYKDDDERRVIDSMLQKTVLYQQNGGQFDASVQCTIPNEWQQLAPYNVGYTAGIETDRVAPEWLTKGNIMDKIITISKHSKNVYQGTSYEATNTQTGELIKNYKCNTDISYVGFPVRDIEAESLDLNLRHDFNFLCVSQLGPRKNVDAVLNNFIEEFKNEDVGLLFKVHGANDSIMDYYRTKEIFKSVSETAKKEGWACSINLLHGNLTDEQMQGLYQHPKVKAMVSLTHGEGFGLPLYEAAYNGLPVVATGWSGHLDFLTFNTPLDSGNFQGSSTKGGLSATKQLFASVKYELKQIPQHAVWNGVLTNESKWAYADDSDARKKMRDVYKNHKKWLKKADKLKTGFEQDASYWYNKFNSALGFEEAEEAKKMVVI